MAHPRPLALGTSATSCIRPYPVRFGADHTVLLAYCLYEDKAASDGMPPALFRKLSQMASTSADQSEIRLRVAGIGFDIQLSVPGPSSTIADVLSIVADETKIPAPYLLLLFRGKKLADGDATLADLKVKDRTRLMLLHGPEYGNDKAGIEALQAVNKELDDLESDESITAKVIDEMVTRACIKLDNIDVSGSETLRSLRREALHRAHEIGEKRG